jgi:hypothetical protein
MQKDYLRIVQRITHLKKDYIYKDCTKDCMNNLDDWKKIHYFVKMTNCCF